MGSAIGRWYWKTGCVWQSNWKQSQFESLQILSVLILIIALLVGIAAPIVGRKRNDLP
jgi:hypothetical protein